MAASPPPLPAATRVTGASWPVRRLRRDPIGFLRQLAQQGDVVPFSLGRRPAVLVNHPDLIERVLVTDQRLFDKGAAFNRARRLLGNGLLTAEGEGHRQSRRLITPVFHRDQMARYGASMVTRAEALAGTWRNGEDVDFTACIHPLTLSIVVEVLFGAELTAAQMADVRAGLAEAIRSVDPLASIVAPLGRVAAARARLRTVVDTLMEARARGETSGDDLLALLLEASEEIGLEQVSDELLTMLLAGHDTIGNALVWTLSLLAQHPRHLERVQQELDRVLDRRPPGPDDIARLPLTRGAFAEAMRLYPPAWIVARRALEPIDLGGTAIPAGTLVIMSQYLAHRDERYFDQPGAFRPERWDAAHDERPRFSYFPFGGGTRACIGEAFAWTEGVLVLATIARRWTLEPAGPSAVAFSPCLTLQPSRPVRMRVTRRPDVAGSG